MKKIVVACIVTLLAAGSSLAARNNVELYVPERKCEQEHTEPPVKSEDAPAVETVSFTEVVSRAEVAPSFPGGNSQLYGWIAKNMVYPPAAAENNIKGRVVVRFAVLSDGSIGETKVIRSVDADLDKEALRLVKSMPKWNPGTIDGKPVNVWYTLPITFNIQ